MGTKRHVVFLHGFLSSPDMWGNITSQISKRNLELHFPCLPGHAGRPMPERVSIDEWVADILQQLPLSSGDSAFFIGHSMGGYVISRLAAKYPSLVRGVCLFHSKAGEDSTPKKEIRNRAIEVVQHNRELYVRGMISSLFAEASRTKLSDAIEHHIDLAGSVSTEVIIASQKVMRDRPDNVDSLRNRPFPLYYFLGEEDTALPLNEIREELEMLPGNTSRIVHDCAHMGHLENPLEAGSFIQRILRADE